ncbi:Spy/CpxP family protein refolding chaperone [Kordia jejudonensis]|uniref:Spy/CpxP family protein refolding chaperone n=1 Tax=Kordia jejudonensis TaxID=1348245 RepID=UPI0006290607|nr:Spy/CpxP family protein refolding chaperone [Kordia jejudonensis]
MKKNTLLYILIAFLVVMNGFFMVKIFGDKRPPRPNPGNFIAKELQFSETQMQEFELLNDAHHEAMRVLSEDIKMLKDELFAEISKPTLDEEKVNNLTKRIGEKTRQKDLKTFYHFREVQKICTAEQSKQFNTIVQKALKQHGKKRRRP